MRLCRNLGHELIQLRHKNDNSNKIKMLYDNIIKVSRETMWH